MSLVNQLRILQAHPVRGTLLLRERVYTKTVPATFDYLTWLTCQILK